MYLLFHVGIGFLSYLFWKTSIEYTCIVCVPVYISVQRLVQQFIGIYKEKCGVEDTILWSTSLGWLWIPLILIVWFLFAWYFLRSSLCVSKAFLRSRKTLTGLHFIFNSLFKLFVTSITAHRVSVFFLKPHVPDKLYLNPKPFRNYSLRIRFQSPKAPFMYHLQNCSHNQSKYRSTLA